MPNFEYDKDYPFAAFITNLGKYNEGSLVGEWVKFPTTYEEMQKVFERIGIGQKDDFGQPYEEWFITDYDETLAKPSIRERLEDAKRECAEHKPPEKGRPGRDTPEHGDL